MKIGEILELTQLKPLDDIAKEHLSIGKVPARKALIQAGCYYERGKKGWHFDGPEEILEKSIYDYSSVKPSPNVTTNKVKNEKTKEVKKEGSEKNMNLNTNEEKNKRKRASFDIDAELLKQLKIKAVVEEKNIYELVEQAIAEFLKK